MISRKSKAHLSLPTKAKTQKLSITRPSPSDSATLYSEGTIKKGGDGNLWVVKNNKKGIAKWTPYNSVELNGLKPLTVDFIAKNIGKELTIYERDYSDKWPKKTDSGMYKLQWIANGDVEYRNNNKSKSKNKSGIISKWLSNKNRETIKDNTMFFLLGSGNWYYDKELSTMSLQVDSKNKMHVSSNIMNREAFVSII